VPRLTAAENIALPLIIEGLDPAERKSRVDAALDAFDLREPRPPPAGRTLRRNSANSVAIARATNLRPTALQADEPTGNHDHRIGAEVIGLAGGPAPCRHYAHRRHP